MTKHYGHYRPYELDCAINPLTHEAGGYYCRHVSALTEEALHAKSDIAAELGWRDLQIDTLTAHAENQAKELQLAQRFYSIVVKERDFERERSYRLEEELAEYKRDAERYRWLRSRTPGDVYRDVGVFYSEGNAGIDVAIDDAIAAEGDAK